VREVWDRVEGFLRSWDVTADGDDVFFFHDEHAEPGKYYFLHAEAGLLTQIFREILEIDKEFMAFFLYYGPTPKDFLEAVADVSL